MKKILFALLLVPTLAHAGDEEFECAKNVKHDHSIECKAKKDGVAIQSIELNGGACESPVHPKIMRAGDKFTVPGTKECGYVAGMTVHTHSGKTLHFHAM